MTPDPSPTLSFYDSDPRGYSDSTFLTDMSDARSRFASRLPEGARVLDLGCGSGRDTLAFSRMGFRVTPVDGSEGMCGVAEGNTGIPVRNITFDELDYDACFDGVWACASLLHVPSSELPDVLDKVRRVLVPGGILFACFKEGDFEGVRDGRHYTDLTVDALVDLLEGCGFEVLETWTSEDGRGTRWSNVVSGSA